MNPKISVFTLVKNEVEYIGYCVMSILPYVDEIVYVDGNSTDGTLELLAYIKKKYDKENKIKVFKNKDCKNFQEDYVRLFNWTIKQCKSDYVWFLHPDMIITNPELIKPSLESGALRYSFKVDSYAGENREKIFQEGRTGKWFTIYQNAFGLHYYGNYGSAEEDCYFKDITGNEHYPFPTCKYLPYKIEDTDIQCYHFCDTKPYLRRLNRMAKCLVNSRKCSYEEALEIAKIHPRVTLEDGVYNKVNFKFKDADFIPGIFNKYPEFKKFNKGATQ